MRINIIKEIFKKEIIDLLRDKKTLFMMVILPILLMPLLMIGFSSVMMMSMNEIKEDKAIIAFDENVDDEIIKYFNENKFDENNNEIISIIQSSKKEYKSQIEDGSLDIYISKEDKDFRYNIYTNSSSDQAFMAEDKVNTIFKNYKEQIIKENIINEGLDVEYILNPITYESVNLAKAEETTGYFLGQILPLIIMIAITMGAIYPSIDIMAGEKERGTLETLLTLPISNLELIMGKYISVSICAITTVMLYIISLGVSGYAFIKSAGVDISTFNLSSLSGPLFITVICIILFTMVVCAISMCICSFAKSFKEAQNYTTPLSLVVMVMSYVTMIPTIKLNSMTAIIPGVNIALLIKSVLSFEINYSIIAIVLITNIAFVILAVSLLSRIFNSEEVLFGDGSGFSFLEKRSNIKKLTLPKASDGILLYAITLIALVYLGGYFQMNYGIKGIAMTQIMLLMLPLAFSYYIKTDFKKVYRLKLPKIKHIIGSIVLWMGGYLIVTVITNILLSIFPSSQEVVEALNEALFMENSLLINLIIVAILPSICEEVLFRGFIMSSFEKNQKSKGGAIIISSVLFGIMHMDFIRIIPTALLGLMMGYATYKSGSILTGSIIHFINNGLSVIVMHNQDKLLQGIDTSEQILMQPSDMIIFIIIGIVLILIASMLFKERKIDKALSE